MKLYVQRLKPGADLKKELEALVSSEGIKAGVVLACVGSLSKATLRMAGATPDSQDIKVIEEKLEIVSAHGTLSQEGMHVHLSVSNPNGDVFGGHLKKGCIVETTGELVIGESESHVFHRREDEETGFRELEVEE